MMQKAVLSLLPLLFVWCTGQDLHAQTGCALVDKNEPAQSLTYELLEEIKVGKEERREMVVLRLRNNTNCEITLLSYDPDPRALELVRTPDGKLSKMRVAGPDDFPDGARLEIKYYLEYKQPLPAPQKRIYVDDTVTEFTLRPGRSVLFSVPLRQFDLWLLVKVPFRFSWDPYFFHPSHDAWFGNTDLPEELFKRTKVCQTVEWCKPAREPDPARQSRTH
jgi:hypothetical protein